MNAYLKTKLAYYKSFFSLPGSQGKFQKILFFTTSGWFAAVSYSTLAWSARPTWNYVNIGIYCIEIIFCLLYVAFFGSFVFNKFAYILAAFCATTLLSFLFNAGTSISTTLLTLCLSSFAFFQFVVQSNKSKKISFVFLLIGCWIYLLHFLVVYESQIFHPSVELGNRIGEFFDNQNTVGKELSLIFLINFCVAILYKKWLLLFPALMSLYFVVLTGSVSNILTIFVVSSLFLIKLFQGKKRIIAILVLCFSVALFFALINVPSFSYYKTRLIDMFLSFLSDGQAGDPSATSRFQGALNGFYLFIERPLFGNGYSATLSNYYIMSHNNFSEVSANYGIFGLIFQEALLLLPIFSIAQKRDPLSIVFFSIALFLFSFQVFLTCFDAKIDYCLMPFVYAHIFQIGPSSLKKSKAIARFSFSVYR